MGKKALKSLKAVQRTKRSQQQISFNRQSFQLGHLVINTTGLNKITRDFLIELYRQKKFDKNLYQFIPLNIDHKDLVENKKRQIVLTQFQAKQIIRSIQIKQQKLFYQNIINKSKLLQIDANKKILICPQNSYKENNYFSKYLKILHKTRNQAIDNSSQSIPIFNFNLEASKTQLLSMIQKACIKIDKQIFTESIVMIIQRKQNQSFDQDDFSNTSVIVLFEQSYPVKQFNKVKLIKLIGMDNYQKKLLATLKIYYYSITKENFYNPLFIVCHDCMKVISSLKYPQHNLYCHHYVDEVKDKYVESQLILKPFSYMKRIIQKDHFSYIQQKFFHSYIQYYLKHKIKGKLSCNRNWCGTCKIQDGQMNLLTKACNFCSMLCRCIRCRKFQKLLKLFSHYYHLGGTFQNISTKLTFNQIFSSEVHNPTKRIDILNESRQEEGLFKYRQELHRMYNKYVKEEHISYLKEWNNMLDSNLISGTYPQTQNQWSIVNQWWQTDKMKLNNQNNNTQLNNKKILSKIPNITKNNQLNIQAKIQNLNQQTKNKLIKAEIDQRRLYRDQMMRTGIFKIGNPLTNYINFKKHDIIIKQKSKFKKNQSAFLQMTKPKQINSFKLKSLNSQKQAFTSKRVQEISKQSKFCNVSKDYLQTQKTKQNMNKMAMESQDEQKQKIPLQQGSYQNSYGSMWQ